MSSNGIRVLARIAGFTTIAALAATAHVGDASPARDSLVVHEWGTFTSVAGEDGVALEWRPLVEGSDLPSFVYGEGRGGGLRGEYHEGKSARTATVRMETPVLYFYAAREQKVSVKVDFPKGRITEWYPQAQRVPEHGIDWGTILVAPGGAAGATLPRETEGSNYYPARATDSDLVRVCNAEGGNELEKFLFYRGVGTFDLPVAVTLDGQRVRVKDQDGSKIGTVIVFERAGSKVGWSSAELSRGEVAVNRPTLDEHLDALYRELEQQLVVQGLYEKEAKAMVATWKDQWFEDGLRVFFVMPRAATDAALPITISPQPDSLVRVLVGRVEVITPEKEKEVAAEITAGTTMAALRKAHGRFAEPIVKRLLAHTTEAALHKQLAALLASQ